MKKTIISGLIIIIILLVFISGCNSYYETDKTGSEDDAGLEGDEESALDIVEKRGFKTNITDPRELMIRSSSIISYKYNLTDTGMGVENYRIWTLGRFVKVRFNELRQHSTGEWYDEILMDRLTKTAFSHCSRVYCPKPDDIDKELEKVEYSDYYLRDPMEYLYKTTDLEYMKEEMLGNQYTKVFKATFEGDEARIWLQEYYGFPLKILVKNDDGTRRTIKFEDMMIDATRRGELDLPFNFTVKGEEDKSWIFWEHYLGEWPSKSLVIEQPGEQGDDPMFGV